MLVALTLGTDLIPQLAQDRFEMTAKLPPGTRLRETDALVRAMQKAHDGDSDIEALYGVSGTGTRLDANPTESGENIAKLSVVLGEHYSSETEASVTERMRKTMSAVPGYRGQVRSPGTVQLLHAAGNRIARRRTCRRCRPPAGSWPN